MGQTEPLDGLLRVTVPHAWVIVAGLGLSILTHRRRKRLCQLCQSLVPRPRYDKRPARSAAMVEVSSRASRFRRVTATPNTEAAYVRSQYLEAGWVG